MNNKKKNTYKEANDVKLARTVAEQDASLIPDLMRLEAEFSQEGNTMGTTDEYEDLIITMEYQLPPDPGEEGVGFYTLHTTSGWSVDNPEELTKLIHGVKQAAIRIGEIKNK